MQSLYNCFVLLVSLFNELDSEIRITAILFTINLHFYLNLESDTIFLIMYLCLIDN